MLLLLPLLAAFPRSQPRLDLVGKLFRWRRRRWTQTLERYCHRGGTFSLVELSFPSRQRTNDGLFFSVRPRESVCCWWRVCVEAVCNRSVFHPEARNVRIGRNGGPLSLCHSLILVRHLDGGKGDDGKKSQQKEGKPCFHYLFPLWSSCQLYFV